MVSGVTLGFQPGPLAHSLYSILVCDVAGQLGSCSFYNLPPLLPHFQGGILQVALTVVLLPAYLMTSTWRFLWSAPTGVPKTGRQSRRVLWCDDHGRVTDMLVCGHHAEDAMLLIIPGNPGSTEFYDSYMQHVHEGSGGALYCVTIGHLGHHRDFRSRQLFSLREQAAHAASVVRRLHTLYPRARIYLAGHSVGAYIALEVLREAELAAVVDQVFCLFPTVHHIGSTPNGRRLYPIMRYFRSSVGLLAWALSQLPRSAIEQVVRWNIGAGVSPSMLRQIHSILHANVATNALSVFSCLHFIA